MAIARSRKVYSDWSGGHWGDLGPFKAANNQYRAVNLQVYRNGTIGPRPGWRELDTTGDPPAPSAGTGSEFFGMLWVPGTSAGEGHLAWISKSDSSATKTLDMASLTWSSLSAIGSPTNDMLMDAPGGGSVYSYAANQVIVGGIKYSVVSTNASNGSVTFPGSFSPRAAVVYRSRMYFWGDSTNRNRIFYSEPNAFSTVNTNNYFDVGINKTVVGAWEVKDALLILTLAGNIAGKQTEAEWWALTGANPQTGALRRVNRGQWPYVAEYVAQFGDVLLWMDVQYDHGVVIHDGADIDRHSLARLVARSGSDTVGNSSQALKPVSAFGEPSVVLPYRVGYLGYEDDTQEHHDNGLQAWELVNGVWTKAVYWGGATEYTVDEGRPFLWGLTVWEGDKLIACTNTSADGSGEFKFFARKITTNRPSTSTMSYEDPDEEHSDLDSGMKTLLWLPAIQSENGAEVRIRKVIVDFNYWKNQNFSPGSTADFKVQVANYRLEDGSLTLTDEYQSDSDALEATDDRHYKSARHTFHFAEDVFYSASQVRFSDLRNVAIDAVTVEYEVNSGRPS